MRKRICNFVQFSAIDLLGSYRIDARPSICLANLLLQEGILDF